jgi:hypothetical protein
LRQTERRIAWVAVALAAAAVGWWAARRGVDFPVYYATALAWRRHGGPLYGPNSGLGWPMYYRYPPLFVLLFAPLTWLPQAWAAGLWAAGKVVTLAALAAALARRLRPREAYRRWVAVLVPVLLAATYLLVEFRYGNVQFYIFALVAAALLLATGPSGAPARGGRAAAGAALLALAAAIKVWPLFFLPYWLARRRFRAAGLAALFLLALTLAPVVAFGWRGNWRLLRQWEAQERTTALEAGSVWYPSQSLRGVLTRYLSHAPAAATGGAYPEINVADWSDAAVSRLWLALEALGYLSFLAWAWRRGAPGAEPAAEQQAELPAEQRVEQPAEHAAERRIRMSAEHGAERKAPWAATLDPRLRGAAMDGVAFCALALLMPFAHIEDLVVIVWPALVAGVLLARRGGRRPAAALLWAAAVWAAVIPLIPGHWAQRWLQVAGADFLVVALLAAGLLAAMARDLDRTEELDRQLRGQTAG